MEVECVAVEDERRLTQLRFDAAVKVIKSLPPDGECSHRSVLTSSPQGSDGYLSDGVRCSANSSVLPGFCEI